MKGKICKSIICSLLIISSLIGSVHCFAKNYTADEVNTRIGGIVSFRAASLNTEKEQGIVDYYASHEMTLGGEWYILSFIQNGTKCDYYSYSEKLISYLKNNEVYSATSREKFALTLIALKATDSFSKKYISDVCNEAIGKQGIMSLVFGLHLLNNGCKSGEFTASSLCERIISLQKADGGWAISGDKSDADVTAMTLQALHPYRKSYSSQIDNAVELLSSMQSENGDYKSYGVYNAESTSQVIIALSSIGIDCAADKRFIKNGNSVIDGLETYRNSDGSFSHKKGDSSNNSATCQALNAFVAYSRFLNGKGAFYSFDVVSVDKTTAVSNDTETKTTEKPTEKEVKTTTPNSDNTTVFVSEQDKQTVIEKDSVTADTSFSNPVDESKNEEKNTTIENEISQSGEGITVNEIIKDKTELSAGSISFTKEFKTKIIISAVILFSAFLCSLILVILKKRNIKNFIVILVAALILITSVMCLRIHDADDYYNSTLIKGNTVGTVTLTVRCDTIIGKDGSPDNPVILDKSEYCIKEGDTVYTILAEALRAKGIPFEHNASYYINGINNLYEFQFGDLSGWMYRVNGETPSVGCNEYVLKDGDEIEWLYTCEIGNDLD